MNFYRFFSRLRLVPMFAFVFLVSGCVLESETPILQEAPASATAERVPDISGDYIGVTGGTHDDHRLSVRRKEGTRNAFIAASARGDSLTIIVAPLKEPGTLLLQLAKPGNNAVLLQAHLAENRLTVYMMQGLGSAPESRPSRNPFSSFSTVFLWDRDTWQAVAKKRGLSLNDNLTILQKGADRENVLAAMNDMFAARALGKGEVLAREVP